jgi:uncharacterized protein (TIGR02996 family)
MTDRAALLRAIAATPWDDLPRLVFADWLDENGEPDRAEYIRLEIEIERHLAAGQNPPAEHLARRRHFAEAVTRWHAELPKLPGLTWGKRFRRGFPVAATVANLEQIVRHAEAFVGIVPLESLKARAVPFRAWEKFLESSILPRLRSLDFTGCELGNDAVADLARTRGVSHLTFLGLARNGLSDGAAVALAASAFLANLEVLDIEFNDFTDAGAEALAVSPHLRKVVSVRHAGNPIQGAGVSGMPWLRWMVFVNRSIVGERRPDAR